MPLPPCPLKRDLQCGQGSLVLHSCPVVASLLWGRGVIGT